jgi:hypothetical protein
LPDLGLKGSKTFYKREHARSPRHAHPHSHLTQFYGVLLRRSSLQQKSYGAVQAKFPASLMLPVPLYTAIFGYGHSGLVMSNRLS